MKDIKKILFVCTGNSCRSIMAEAYMKKRAEEKAMALDVRSAGTLGVDGMPPSAPAKKMLSDEGIDPSGYSSTGLTETLTEWADIILVMEPIHKFRVQEISPENVGKVQYLGAFNPDANDVAIPDPIGRPVAFYRTAFGMIKSSVEEFIKWLEK